MTKRWIFIFASLFIVLIAAFFILGAWAENQTSHTLEHAGLTTAKLPAAEKSLGAVTYRDISLDADSISTIKRLQASYGFNGGEMMLDGLQLTGDVFDGLSFSGFNTENFPYSLANLSLKTLILQNAKTSVLTRDIGGISVSFNGQALRKNKALEYQARFQSKQKYFEAGGQMSGIFYPHEWSLDGEIEYIKFDFPFWYMKISRAHGHLSGNGTEGQPEKFVVQVNAGGAEILGLPWNGLTATLETLGTKTRMYGNAKSFEKLELSFDGAGQDILYTVFSPDYKTLSSYLQKHNRMSFFKDAKLDKNAKNITLNLRFTAGGENPIHVFGSGEAKKGAVSFDYTVKRPE